MGYISLIEQINGIIQSNEEMALGYKRLLNLDGDLLDPSYTNAYSRLFRCLDKLSASKGLKIRIEFESDRIYVYYDGRSIRSVEFLALYKPILEQIIVDDRLSSSCDISEILSELRNCNDECIILLRSLLAVCKRIDIPVEHDSVFSIYRDQIDSSEDAFRKVYYIVNGKQFDNYEVLNWRVWVNKVDDYYDFNSSLNSLIVLFPNEISKAKQVLSTYPKDNLVFLDAESLSIDSDVLSVRCSRVRVDSFSFKYLIDYKDTINLRCVDQDEYWLVFPKVDVSIPAVSRKSFEVDPNTPNYFSLKGHICIGTAIRLEGSYSSNHLSIDSRYHGMTLYSSSRWDRELFLPFLCNAPFVIKNSLSGIGSEHGNISLDSAWNKWLLSQLPDLFFSQVSRIPSPLIDVHSFSRIIPRTYEGANLLEEQKILNTAIKSSQVPFIPSIEKGIFLKYSDSYFNNTSILSFDSIVTRYLEKKYSRRFQKELHTTKCCKELIKIEFTIEDAINLLTSGQYIQNLDPERYALFMDELYKSLLAADYSIEFSYKERSLLASNRIILNTDGKYVRPNQVLLDDMVIDGYNSVHPSLHAYLDKGSEYYQSFWAFLKSIGAYEYVSLTVMGEPISFLEEGYKNSVVYLDKENRISEFIPYKVSEETGRLSFSGDAVEIKVLSPAKPDLFSIHIVIKDRRFSYHGIVNRDGRIIVPFGYNRVNCEYRDDLNYVLFGDCRFYGSVYSLNGTEIFPGDNPDSFGLKVCSILNDGTFIINNLREKDNQSFAFLSPDSTVTPFEAAFYRLSYYPDSYEFNECENGLVIVSCHSRDYGYSSSVIDTNGHALIPFVEGKIHFSSSNKCFIATDGGDRPYYVYDSDGEDRFRIETHHLHYDCYTDAIRWNNDYLLVSRWYNYGQNEKTLYGFADTNFNIVFPIISDKIIELHNNYYRFCINDKEGVYFANNRSVVIPPMYDYIYLIGENLLVAVKGCTKEYDDKRVQTIVNGGKKQLFDLDGNTFFGNKCFDEITLVDDHIVARESKWESESIGKCGVLGLCQQQRIIPFDYDHIKPVPGYVSGKYVQNKYYLVNIGGQIDSQNKNKKSIMGGKWGLYKGNLILANCTYDSIQIKDFPGNVTYFIVEESERFGLFDSEGKSILPIEFSLIVLFWSDVVRLNEGGAYDNERKLFLGGTWRFYDLAKADYISPKLEFDYVGDFHSGFAICLKEGKWGYLNEKYSIAIGFIFEYAEDFNFKGEAKVVLDGENIIIDKYANQIGEWHPSPERGHHDYDGNEGFDYSQDDLDDMYRGAYENDPEAQWNND